MNPPLPRPSARWRRHAEVYRFFAERQCQGLDFSEEAARRAYGFESAGVRHDLVGNGYVAGKHWANVQVAEWKAGVRDRLSLKSEFRDDPELLSVRWWVDAVLEG